jgi:cysteine-rich repeat protein
MLRIRKEGRIRLRGLGVAVVAIAALSGACTLSTETQFCERTGRRCGPGWVCTADQSACTPAGGCGDGVINADKGEVCDDGNIFSGDGCSSDCKSSEICGNGILDEAAGESCDDGNTMGGDDCSPICTLEACGNLFVDTNEACDTGGDSATCDMDCTLRVCGDGYVNQAAGEECDASGFETVDCDSDCTQPACGDGHRNAAFGEGCDVGIACPAPMTCNTSTCKCM